MKKNKIVCKITTLILLTLATMMTQRADAVTQQEAQQKMVDTFSTTEGFKFRNMIFDKMVTLDSLTKVKLVNTQEEFYKFVDSRIGCKNDCYLVGKDTGDTYEFWFGNLGSAELTLYKNGEKSKAWKRDAIEMHDAAGKFVRWSSTDWREENIIGSNQNTNTNSCNKTVNSVNNIISNNTGTGASPTSPLMVNGGHWILGSDNKYYYYDKNQNKIIDKYVIDNGKVYRLDNDGMLWNNLHN